jgi:hypothetical protein
MSLKRFIFIALSPVITIPSLFTKPSLAEIILPGRCYQGSCHETLFQGKTLLEQGPDGTLYAVEIARRRFRGGSEPTGDFEAVEEIYVYCSTTRPAYIRPESPGSSSYFAGFLNPGGQPIGASMSVYPIYWATCHNFVGPNFFSDEMRSRAVDLGYPLNLRESQINLSNPREILDE